MAPGERACGTPPPLALQVYKQKVKHLLYEHQNNLAEVKAEGTVVMKLAQKEHRTQEGALRKDMRVLKVELKEQELANEVVIKNLCLVGPLHLGRQRWKREPSRLNRILNKEELKMGGGGNDQRFLTN